MLVDLDDTAHNAAIVLKMAVPIGVTQHQVRCAVRSMLVGDMEEAAQIRLNLHRIEVIPSDLITPDLGWIPACIEQHLGEDIGRQAIEAAVAIAQIEIVGIGSTLLLFASALDGVKAVRMGHVERPQNQRIQHRKHHRVGADGQGQRQNRGDGESRRSAEIAHSKAHIGPDRLQGWPLPHFTAALLNQRQIAKCDTRLAFSFLRAQALACQLRHTFFQVKTQLFGEIVEALATTKDVRYPLHWKPPSNWTGSYPDLGPE